MRKPRRPAGGKQSPGDTGQTTMKTAPQTLPEALDVIRAMHKDLLAFRNPEFDLIAPGRDGEFDDRVKAVLAHSAPVIKADRHDSDCAVHNAPAMPAGPCDCGAAAPSVTPADVEATIASEHYYTAADGDFACRGRRPMALPDDPLALVLHCTIMTKNGQAVTGTAYCQDANNQDLDAARKSARADAIRQLWPMVIYAERERLAAPPSIQLTPFEVQSNITRVRWAEGLILQLPADHDGRNSWLLNFGSDKAERQAEWARRNPQSPLAQSIAAAPDTRPNQSDAA